jgi:hypothetical protein
MVDPRFSQLLQLAKDGDEASVAALWWEFDFDFHAEVSSSAPSRLCEESLSDTRHATPDTLEGGM